MALKQDTSHNQDVLLDTPAKNAGAIAAKSFLFPGDVASVPDSREQVMEFVCDYSSDHGDDEIDIFLSLQEALANAALHGCQDDAAKQISCHVEVAPGEIVITVRDPGPGFDVSLTADTNRVVASTSAHGRGIALMRSMMTEVQFGKGGSEVTLRKRLRT